MNTFIIIKVAVDGLHNWPNARKTFPEVGFLSDIHRHMFHIKLCSRVFHSDRDKEFIIFKRDVCDYLYKKYYREDYRSHFFGSMSCEMIAEELLTYFDCEWVEVFEDDENGARVER